MKVGQVVICVNGHFNDPDISYFGWKTPVTGKIYTIREVFDKSLTLEEIVNPSPVLYYISSDGFTLYTGEPAFKHERFRLVYGEDIKVKGVKESVLS